GARDARPGGAFGHGCSVLLERPVRRQDPVPGGAGGHRHRASGRGRRTKVSSLLRARRGCGRRGRRRTAGQGDEGPRQNRCRNTHFGAARLTAMPRVAILDDYAGMALELADWSPVQARSEITVFDRHLSEAEAAEALQPFDVICTMRERMALPRTLI